MNETYRATIETPVGLVRAALGSLMDLFGTSAPRPTPWLTAYLADHDEASPAEPIRRARAHVAELLDEVLAVEGEVSAQSRDRALEIYLRSHDSTSEVALLSAAFGVDSNSSTAVEQLQVRVSKDLERRAAARHD